MSAEADAALMRQAYHPTIDGAPVDVFVVSDDGRAPQPHWAALPAKDYYPAPGVAVPVLASRFSASVAVNGNFYREESRGTQEPIGLVVHEGAILSPSSKFYPTAGVLEDGALVWDDVRLEATVATMLNGKRRVTKLCRFNAKASKDCAALWFSGYSSRLPRATLFAARETGLPIGATTLAAAASGSRWAIQWPPGELADAASRVESVTIDVHLVGRKLGERWQKAREAVSGSHVLTPTDTHPNVTNRTWAMSRQPRTMLGTNEAGHAFVAVFDGRRETSRGVSVPAAWDFLRKNLGAAWAINLDGGGSSTLVHEGALVNKPADGAPRAVAVGWGAL
jgi:hypothetical protein